jgi:hypothetical protein
MWDSSHSIDTCSESNDAHHRSVIHSADVTLPPNFTLSYPPQEIKLQRWHKLLTCRTLQYLLTSSLPLSKITASTVSPLNLLHELHMNSPGCHPCMTLVFMTRWSWPASLPACLPAYTLPAIAKSQLPAIHITRFCHDSFSAELQTTFRFCS